MRELEEKLKTLSREKIDWITEKDTLLADFRMREMQLKNINKSLKEDVQLRSHSSPGTPTFAKRDSQGVISTGNHDVQYLKAIFLKFIETKNKANFFLIKSQKSQLVHVLGKLLNFTADETILVSKEI